MPMCFVMKYLPEILLVCWNLKSGTLSTALLLRGDFKDELLHFATWIKNYQIEFVLLWINDSRTRSNRHHVLWGPLYNCQLATCFLKVHASTMYGYVFQRALHGPHSRNAKIFQQHIQIRIIKAVKPQKRATTGWTSVPCVAGGVGMPERDRTCPTA